VTLRFALVAAMLLFVSACDEPPGLPPPTGEPPALASISVTPSDVDVTDLSEGAVSEGRVRFTVEIEVEARSAGSGIEEIRYTIRRPDRLSGGIVTTGTLQANGNRYNASVDIDLPVGAVGNYQVVVTARGPGGTLSNQMAAMLRYRADGSAPVIEEVVATPNPFRPPGTLTIIVTASDPDGLENIAGVFGETPTGAEFELFDDGQTFGDEVAGDGRFTARFDVDAATPGTQTFRFWAIDLIGLRSEVVEYEVVIE
jgi:hypothetical protein